LIVIVLAPRAAHRFANVSTCQLGHENGSGEITIDEILKAVNHALGLPDLAHHT